MSTSKREQSKEACIGLITSGEAGVANLEVERSLEETEHWQIWGTQNGVLAWGD